jgi:ADP-ribose pyrophosphatase YjhB (NUDIX family)
VVNGDQLLLVRRAKAPFAGYWDIPGGFCNPTELPRDGAVREVREETGLDITITGLLGMWMDRYVEGHTIQDTLNIYFTATVSGDVDPVVDPVEVTEIGWFHRDELPSQIAFADHASAVLDAWRAGFGD